MGLCTCCYHQLVRELLIIIKDNGQRGIVPLTEAKTEMIHGQLSLGKLLSIHLVRASQSLSSSMEKFFSPLKPSMIEMLRQKKQKTQRKQRTRKDKQPNFPREKYWSPLPTTRLVRIACFARRSMLPRIFADLSVVSRAPGEL